MVPQDPNDEPASALFERIRAEKARLVKEGRIRKDKPLLEIAEEEKPFALPDGWEWVRLGAVGEIGSSSRVHQRDWTNEGVPFYRAREIVQLSSFGSVPSDLFISEQLFSELSAGGLIPEANDLMITGVGTIGVPYVVRDIDRFYFKDASVLILKNRYALFPYFLFYFMKSPYWGNTIHAHSMGTTVHTLTIGRACEVPFPLPPLAEQSRIVARVEELMALCDSLEANGKLEGEQHARLVGSLFESLANSESAHALAENWQRIATHFDLLLDRPAAVDALEQTILQLAVRGLLVPQDPTDEPASALLQKIRHEKDSLIAAGKIKRDKPLPPIAAEEKPFELPAGWEWATLNAIAYLNPDLFFPGFSKTLDKKSGLTKHHEWLAKHAGLIGRSKEEFIRHNRDKYGLPLAIWVVCEIWDFGTLSTLFAGMREDDQDLIATQYGVGNGRLFATWLRSLNYLRNVCAHHSRLWNRNIVDQPKLPDVSELPWAGPFIGNAHRLARPFLLFCIAKHMLDRINPSSSWGSRFRSLLAEFPDQAGLSLEGMGKPTGDWDAELWG